MAIMQSAVESAASIFEKRFLKNAFLPVLLLPVAILAPWSLQGSRLNSLEDHLQHQSLAIKIIEVALYFGNAWFLAAILASQWRNVIRLFEGYPLMRLPWVGRACAKWYQAKAAGLESDPNQSPWLLYYNFPMDSGDFLPTRLGNVLCAAERYPYYRYGADSIVLWPRLYHILPRDFVDDVEEARASLEFLLVISLWCIAAGAGALILLVASHSSFVLMLFILVVSAIGSYAFYVSAIWAAVEYGEELRSGMELFRLQLLERMKLRPPKNLRQEQETWNYLLQFIGSNAADLEAPYVDPDPPHLVINLPDLGSLLA